MQLVIRTRLRASVAATLLIVTCTAPARAQIPLATDLPFRSITGSGNNAANPLWGCTGSMFVRMMPAAYADGISVPSGQGLPGPRAISNAVCAQNGSIPNREGYSDFLWQWGQFIDHDMTMTFSAEPLEPFPVVVPAGDPYFDPAGTGAQLIDLDRSEFEMVNGVRQQMNSNTSFIDGSQVYGSDPARARELRSLDGTGRLRTSPGNLLPYNVHGFRNFPVDDDPTFFLAGDVRANEQVGLTAMHTVFVREHNYVAGLVRRTRHDLDDETVYQAARAIVGAEIQAITYREFLPALLGPDALRPYDGYHGDIDATIETEFATAAYRMGHTLLSPQLLRLDEHRNPTPAGSLPLKDAFFSPATFVAGGGPDPLLRGLATQPAQEFDAYVVDGVRNFLFGPPGAGGFDLASLNLQRGRDHGIPRYNDMRVAMGMRRATTFADISSDPNVQAHFASVYASVDDVDLWIGLIAEDHHPGAVVGELAFRILKDQFERLRDGDRFWYENVLPRPLVNYVERQTLATIIRRNTGIGRELQDDVFHLRTAPRRALAAATDQVGGAGGAGTAFAVGEPSPNPARGAVSLGLALSGDASRSVEASVFDVQGRRVKTLLDERMPAGTLRITWDRTDDAGGLVAHGIYFIRLRSGSFIATRRVLVVE